jgi:hypothetical protein
MSKLIAVALYHRDHFSQGNGRRIFGHEAFHWAVMITPEVSNGQDCQCFDATDSSEVDANTFRMNNPSMDWWFRAQPSVNPVLSPAKLLGRLVIGRVPEDVSDAELQDLFRSVPLPVKNTHPQQSSVTWAVDAIRMLQSKGWVSRSFSIDRLKDAALSYADDRVTGASATQPEVKYYDA